jgi:hypothetical protein
MITALQEYYRCPEEFARFGVVPELGRASGFFNFGKQITCFGRSAGPVDRVVNPDLPDVLPMMQVRGEEIALPFDADEILDNLRRERYVVPDKDFGSSKKLIRNMYYTARPFLPVGIRKYFQRFHLRARRRTEFPAWPLDKTVDNLCAELMALSVKANGNRQIPFVWFWPDEFKGCVLMTHDVEHEEGREFCGDLMDLDDRHGIRSSFQVIPEERYAVSDSFLDSIRARGFELNVHDLNHDGHLFQSHEQFLRRAQKINEYTRKWRTVGFRTGALYRNVDWYEALQLEYDMSSPNAAHLEPQNGGCCTVMPYLVGGLVELPLTSTQDYSLFHILGQYSIELWKEEIDGIAASNGLATFIVHPDYVIDRRARRVYENLLRHLSELCSRTKLWQPLPRDAARWWRERSQMRIERSRDSWKVLGPGSERACLAFARIEDGRLTYHVEKPSCRESVA